MMLADTMEMPLCAAIQDLLDLRLHPLLHRDPPAGEYLVHRHRGDRLGQRRFRGGFDEGGGIVDLEQKLRRIADHVLQDQGHVDDVGVAGQKLQACRHFAVSGRQDETRLRFS